MFNTCIWEVYVHANLTPSQKEKHWLQSFVKSSAYFGWNCYNFSTTTTITTIKKNLLKTFLVKLKLLFSVRSKNSVRVPISNSFVTVTIFSIRQHWNFAKIAVHPAISIFVNDIININSQTFSAIWIYPIVVNLLPAAAATATLSVKPATAVPAQLHVATNICNKKEKRKMKITTLNKCKLIARDEGVKGSAQCDVKLNLTGTVHWEFEIRFSTFFNFEKYFSLGMHPSRVSFTKHNTVIDDTVCFEKKRKKNICKLPFHLRGVFSFYSRYFKLCSRTFDFWCGIE